ncbi:MAG: O-antigen ligase family protein [Patescibacteria group bacterium]|nr:O-antigen ligase family protein [Patescibacteria group bacterium]
MNINEALRWSVIGGILVIFFIPLFVANSLFFPFITGKGFAFRILVEIVFALWLILALRDPSARPGKSLLVYAVGAFLLGIGVADIFAVNPDKAFWSNFERMEGWVTIAHLAAYFFVAASVFNTEKSWKVLWNTTIIVSVIESIQGIRQLLHYAPINQGGVRLDGTFGNATYLAIYMLFSFFITLLMFVWTRGKNSTATMLGAWYGLAMLLQVVMVFYTATRGTILGLIGGLFIAGLTFLFTAKENKALRKWGIGAVIAIVLLSGGFIAIRNAPFVQQNEVLGRLAGIATPQSLLEQGTTRFAIWQMAWKGFLERPIFGWGQEGFNYVFNQNYQPSLYSQEAWFDRAHDEFLDWLVATGIVGFLLYVSLFALAFWYLWRPRNNFTALERGLFTGLLAGYAFHNLFVFDNLVSYIFFFTILAYLAFRSRPAVAALSKNQQAPAPMRISKSAERITSPLIIVLMGIILYFVNVPGIATASDIIQGLTPHSEGITANFDYFQKAVARAGNGGLGLQEVREQLVQFALQVKQLNAGDAAFQAKVLQYAEDQMVAQVAASPKDARIRVFFGSYLHQIGKLDEARTQLLAAHDLSPNKQAILFELGSLELDAGNTALGLKWLKEAYDLDPSYDTAVLDYAAGEIRSGDSASAASMLMPRFHTVTPDDDAILTAYLSVKDYKDALAILKARVAKNPNDYQAHVVLAAGYLQSGDRADAIAELKKAIDLNEAFAPQGQAYINQIQSGSL